MTLGRRIFDARYRLSTLPLGTTPRLMPVFPRISQTAFGAMIADYLGKPEAISGATVSRWEADKAAPDLDTLSAIADLCKVDIAWLVAGTGDSVTRTDSVSPAPMPPDERVELERKMFTDLLEQHSRLTKAALEQTRHQREATLRELRACLEDDTPFSRRKCRELVRKLEETSPIDTLVRTLFMSEDEAQREWERDLERERRNQDEDVGEV